MNRDADSSQNATPLVGLVAAVISERELALNIGTEQGVKDGMRFKIVAPKPFEIRDPITNEVLGSIEREKLRVEVSRIYSKFTICRTYSSLPASAAALEAALAVAEPAARIEAAIDAKMPPLSLDESLIKIGDKATQIL